MDWTKLERQVCKLQKRIYRAATREDHRQARRLQKLLLRSRAAKLLAVRNVTQDNQGKKTPGVDEVTNLTPQERLDLVPHLHLQGHASPVRRVSMPKPGTTEPRPLGIPTMADRAQPALVNHVWEPAWEAPFEPNSDGCRPGRSTWDAIGALDVQINQKPQWVLDADIATCFGAPGKARRFQRVQFPPRKGHSQPTGNRVLGSWR